MTTHALSARAWAAGGVDATAPSFDAGDMVELTPESGWRGDRPALFQVERCRPAGDSGWGYLTGYLPGHGHTSTFYLDLRAVLPTTAH